MIDTHCHLTSDALRDRVDDVLDAARAEGVNGVISVAVTSDDAREALALAERHEDVWCTAGVHPLYADGERDWSVVREVAASPRCVAWGELGLDNHYERPPRELQDGVLAEQIACIESAADDGLVMPVVVHCRDAFDELLAVFGAARLDPARYVFHCFSGGPEEARRVLDFGASISFTGIVTFKNATEVAEAAKIVPADRIMAETDAPYLTPAPHRKVWPNEPRYVVHTVRRLAEVRGVAAEEMERVLDENATRFFGLGGQGS
ncbi:MAG: TatD family hydrolase [Planctomycetes bacterium]|nr:TatD family hydrolase [Planctomycetota bacterium]